MLCVPCVGGDRAGRARRLSFLTEHRADLVGQHRVGVVQPAAAAQALLEAVEDGLVGKQHHQDPQCSRDCAGVEMLLHEHQEPVEAQCPDQLLTRPGGRGGSGGEGKRKKRRKTSQVTAKILLREIMSNVKELLSEDCSMKTFQ